MKRALVLVALATALGGCDWLDKTADDVRDAADPIVAVGIVERIEAPRDLPDGITLPDELKAGTAATMFLADARSADQLDQAPVPGATMVLSGCGDDAELEDGGDGSYSAVGVLPGCEGPFVVDRTDVDPPSVLPVTLPDAQDPGVPETWTAGTDLVLDLSGAGWNAAVVVVVDLEARELTYTSKPDGILAWYTLLEGQQDLSAVTIPGSAFRADREHVVAITGLLRTKKGAFDNVNSVLSTVDGGRTTIHLLTTRTPPG